MKSLLKIHDEQTRLEEVFNSFSHSIGIVLGIVGLVILTIASSMQGHIIKIVSSLIYGSSIVSMYTASSLYHIAKKPETKRVLKILDHISIYLLIAGSYTPFTLISMPNAWGWSLCAVIWGLALAGCCFKLFFTGRFQFLSVSIYLFMGWLAVIAAKPLIHSLPLPGLIWLGVGGLFYTLGVVFYVLDGKYHFSHFIWHLFVLAGSICQFFAILFYVIL